MKFPAVFLALLLFTGSQASSPSPEASEGFDFGTTFLKVLAESIRNSEVGQGINSWLVDSLGRAQTKQLEMQQQLQQVMERITTDVQAVQQKVPPLVKGLAKEMQSLAEGVGGRLQQMQEGLYAASKPYAHHICPKLCQEPSP